VDMAAIEVEQLGKRYRIGLRPRSYGSLRENIMHGIGGLWGSVKGLVGGAAPGQGTDEVWALKDVTLSIPRGEILGVIGRNGAGKTTLLRILSRITEPTEGQAVLRGRVGSLLEVGTGFHPELTGRDNIYLSGAVLGMKKSEIRAKFDQIVAFAEIEKFLDTPIKRYSSGMNVRLGFAVAAHLEPEIMLVDEVLAVGDAAFQRKCLKKMDEVAQGGRTVLFVSHNMGMIRHLCSSAILLDGGRLAASGGPADIIEQYLKGQEGGYEGGAILLDESRKSEWASDVIDISEVRLLQREGVVQGSVDANEPLDIEIRYTLKKDLAPFRIKLRLTSLEGIAFHSDDTTGNIPRESRHAGAYISSCRIPPNLLNAKRYSLVIGADQPSIRILVPFFSALALDVVDTSGQSRYDRNWPGAVRPLLDWRCSRGDT